jgi:mRNA interferase YafQ
MRTIKSSSKYKRDYKRESKGRHADSLDDVLRAVLNVLVCDGQLEERYRDHALTGNWKPGGFRECHIKPDLLLIYRKVGSDLLEVARLGSHSELFS